MNLSNKQLQTLTQQQKLTLRQQYHLKLLAYNDQQLLHEIEQQVEKNPLLDCDESFFQINHSSQESFYDQSLRYVCIEKTLQEELLEQVHTYPTLLSDALCNYLIESLDDNGYLRIPMATIEQDTGYHQDDIEDTLAILQTFEPYGVFARNLQECLLIQLCHDNKAHPLAIQIVNDHLDLLALNKLQDIGEECHASLEEVKQAVACIRSLQPKPGAKYSKQSSYIFPEVKVTKDHHELMITLTNAVVPLHINHTYEDSSDIIVQAYVKKHIKDAQNLIDGLHKRQETLYKIVQYIVSYQKDFFLQQGQLKGLTLQMVAKGIAMHESTISRCVSSKSLEFNQHIYPLKFFFPTQLENGHSNNEIQLYMKELIHKENKQKPLSDQQIADLLKKENIIISRRAIAKYRDSLQIPSASKRKVF